MELFNCQTPGYEGQSSSNGLIKKVKDYGINTISYVYSPMPEHYLGLCPSKVQIKERVVARKYAIQGHAWEENICQFSNIECIIAPSFRYKNIFDKERANVSSFEVLAVLPGVFEDAKQFLKELGRACQKLSIHNILIKNHLFFRLMI